MSWDAQKEYMDDYRNDRYPALNNEEKQKWFTTPLGTVAELFTDYWERTPENDGWEGEYKKGKKADIKKLQHWRLKIAAMCSGARDLRSQFAAWDDHRIRRPLDWDRFEYQRTGYLVTKLDHFDQVLKDKEAGMVDG
jgi:hypothetical protein